MRNTFSKMSLKVAQRYQSIDARKRAIAKIGVTAFCLALPEFAFANAGAGFFCYVAQYFKQIVGTAALVAIGMWALEHIFGVSKLHDIVIKVGTAAALVIAGATLITNSGLTTSCII